MVAAMAREVPSMDHAITAREEDDLWFALEHNFGDRARLALYDIDQDRWVAIRRAVRAGYYTEEVAS